MKGAMQSGREHVRFFLYTQFLGLTNISGDRLFEREAKFYPMILKNIHLNRSGMIMYFCCLIVCD